MPSINETVCIFLHIEGRLYGTRRWRFVPRIGDAIVVEGDKAGVWLIDQIVWYEDNIDNPVVNIHCIARCTIREATG